MNDAASNAPDPRVLDAVPIRNESVREQRDTGSLILSVPIHQRWYQKSFLKYLLPFSTHRRVELDELGEAVWQLVDGEHSVEAIAEAFAEERGLAFHESLRAVTQFLAMLAARRMLIVLPPGEAADRAVATADRDEGESRP